MKLFRPLNHLLVGAALCASAAGVQALQLGVNAGVSTRESPFEVKKRYAPLADKLSRQLGEPVDLVSVISSEVRATLVDKTRAAPELMFVHTHHAFEAGEPNDYRVIAVSTESSGNRVHFLAPKGSPVKTVADLRGRTLGLTGRDSFASAMARSELRALGIDPETMKLHYTDYQDAAFFMLEHNFAAVATLRSDKAANDWKAKGNLVVHSGPARPVYVLIARKSVEPARAAAVLDVLRSASADPKLWEGPQKAGITGFDAPSAAQLDALRAGLLNPLRK